MEFEFLKLNHWTFLSKSRFKEKIDFKVENVCLLLICLISNLVGLRRMKIFEINEREHASADGQSE